MTFSQRERLLVIATGLVVALFLADLYVIRPLENRGKALKEKQAQLVAELSKSENFISERRKLSKDWDKRKANLLTDPAESESKLLHSLRQWASESGLSLAMVKPERKESETALHEITVQASGTGGMDAVSGFLWRMENCDIPLRLNEVQIGARREGTDDLSLQIKASTLYIGEAPRQKQAAKPAATEDIQ